VLITGGSGFIGSHLTEQLLSLGYRVRVFDSLETGNLQFLNLREPKLEFHYGNIMDIEALRRAMKGVRGVFHLGAASKVLPSLKNPAMGTFNVERNSVGTSRVLEAANETKIVKKVMYAASSTYYGNQPVPHVETDHFMPTSPYAASKFMGELIMSTNDNLYKLHTLSLRFFMVYGPRNPSAGAYAIVTGKFIGRLKAGLPLTIEGDGTNFRDFVHADDISRALILGYQSDIHGTHINAGSGETHSVKEVADLVSSNQVHVAARKNDLLGTLADTCKAKQMLNFQTRKDFVTVMKEMIADAKDGRADYLAPMWEEARVQDNLESKFGMWRNLTHMDRNDKLRAALDADRNFLHDFLLKL
jgi:nucleoside-diphosphate-sugar epimerase